MSEKTWYLALVQTRMLKRWIAIVSLAVITASVCLGQTAPSKKPQDRTKTFGQSLDRKRKLDQSKAVRSGIATDDPGTIRVKTDLVVSDVLVVNSKGNLILGLKKDDFLIKENGVNKPVEYFGASAGGAVPRSIVLILDYSYSM